VTSEALESSVTFKVVSAVAVVCEIPANEIPAKNKIKSSFFMFVI
jgi:hypothetical protein